MKSFFRKTLGVLRAVLSASLKVLLLAIIIELVLTALAITVGIFVALNYGLFAGLAGGVATFLTGQAIAILVFDIMVVLPSTEKLKRAQRLETDEEVIARLKSELKAASEDD